MNSLEFLVTLTILCLVVVIALAVMFFRGHVNLVRIEAEQEGKRLAVLSWFGRHTWECIQIIDDANGGPFGPPVQKLVLQKEHERIVMAKYSDKVKVGTRVKLRPLLHDERNRVSFGIVDTYMAAEPT